MLFNRERVIPVTIRFENTDEWLDFNGAVVKNNNADDILAYNFRKGYYIDLRGDFGDGHLEATFPLKEKRINEFEQKLKWFWKHYL